MSETKETYVLAQMGVGFVSKPGCDDGEYTSKLENAQVFGTMRDAFAARTGLQRIIPMSELNKDRK